MGTQLQLTNILGYFEYVKYVSCSWAERNHESLTSRNSTIEFNLHKMNFLMLLNSRTQHSRGDALGYAKIFQMFAPKHAKGDLFVECLGG